jgi:hypothetical protein
MTDRTEVLEVVRQHAADTDQNAAFLVDALVGDGCGVTDPDELLNDRTFETAASLRDALSTIEGGTA